MPDDIKKRQLYYRVLNIFRFGSRRYDYIPHDGKLLVIRIAAVEGDIIERNGISIKVLEGCYYVLGDNVDKSYDSRYWINLYIRKRILWQGCSFIERLILLN